MKEFERCIVVDSIGKPMVFDENRKQFLYCSPMSPKATKRSSTNLLRSYQIKEANQLISQHIETRKAKGWETGDMQVIPFYESK